MLFGLITIVNYIIFMSNFDTLTIIEAKNFIIFVPIIFILSLVELFFEIKYGIKKTLFLTKKITIRIFKIVKYNRLKKKLDKNKDLTANQIKWLEKYMREKDLC